MRSCTNYILGTFSCLFHNVAVWDAQHNTNHYLILGCLPGAAPAAHSHYLRKVTRSPIMPPSTLDRVSCMFAELQGGITSPPWREHHRQEWIWPETCSLINTRIVARRQMDQQSSRALNRTIKAGLQEHMCRRAAEVVSVVEPLFASDPPLIQEPWIQMW